MKRNASPDTTGLIMQPGPGNSAKTPFEEEESTGSGPWRSKRVRYVAGEVQDIEDSVQSSGEPVQQLRVGVGMPHPAPARWREAYDAITNMRAHEIADVDTMGCQLAQEAEREPVARRVSTLVSLMLSSQTTDRVCHTAIQQLRAAVGGALTVNAILAADRATILAAINKVGFKNKKTDYIMKMAQRLQNKHNLDVPKTFDELCDITGVGAKMATLTLSMAWNIHVGIGVDVHINRITNRLGWNMPATSDKGQEKQTKLNLESWLPRELWYDINHKFVGFGQTICRPVNPHCHRCDLNLAGLCPSANIGSSKKKGKIAVTKRARGPKVKIAVELE